MGVFSIPPRILENLGGFFKSFGLPIDSRALRDLLPCMVLRLVILTSSSRV